ncbi:ATP-binding protein [Trichocoleus desertorum AS-A10]|uniref:sensor histidine kinase n=1 Tax=Trichocoleus desertorum TaxID=1481672 RepID=UPI003299A726
MQVQNPSSPHSYEIAVPQPHLSKRSLTSEASFQRVKQWVHGASIRRKIGSGYAVAIGVALLGTTAGLTVGDYYQNQAQKQLTRAVKQEQLLSELQRNVLHMRLHHHEFVPLLEKPALFEAKHDHFLSHIDKTQKILPSLQSVAATENSPTLTQFLQSSQGIVRDYFQQMEVFLRETNPQELSTTELKAKQAWLLQFSTSEASLKFDGLLDNLVQLIESNRQEQQRAEVALADAKTLRTEIIALSMVLSVSIAAILAVLTSRAIARPLESVTKVAQRATKESNFELQAPITTQDEVGLLAAALNGLMQCVTEHTHELQTVHQTLEKRVEERTAELWRKNEQLAEAHDHLQQLNGELVSQAHELHQALQELRQTQAQLIQTEKMSSLGQMVAGFAHEINNPITFVAANLNYANTYMTQLISLVQLYQQQYPHPPAVLEAQIADLDVGFVVDDLPKVLASMQAGTDRIRQLVLSLRNFSRLDEAEMKPVDIHEGIDNTLLILNHRLAPEISIVKQYSELPLVECYPAQLNQVFMHLLNNAIDALLSNALLSPSNQARKQITIETEVLKFNQIKICIADNGPGISSEFSSKLFDPFFTTKPVGQGTGLGLAICYQIIEKHHGKIEVASEIGQGAKFMITLPIQAISSANSAALPAKEFVEVI